jgi:hypothetical protein
VISSLWKAILTITIILLSVFFIFGMIGRAFQVSFKRQERKVDKFMAKLVTTKIVRNEKDFKRIAKYKTRLYFVRHSIFPVCLGFLDLIAYIIGQEIDGWNRLIFPLFGRMIYPWNGNPTYVPILGFDFSNIEYAPPNMSDRYSIFALVVVIVLFITMILYFYQVIGYIARQHRISRLADKMFSRDLDEVDLMSFINTRNPTIMDDNEKKVPQNPTPTTKNE